MAKHQEESPEQQKTNTNPKPSFQLILDHAAVATSEPQKLKHVLSLLGFKPTGSEDVTSQGVRTHFFSIPASSPNVEILEVLDPQGVVAKFLNKKGPGIHHLSFQVASGSLPEIETYLRQNQIRLVYEQSKPGAHNTRVNFIHPESTGGILVELSEKPSLG